MARYRHIEDYLENPGVSVPDALSRVDDPDYEPSESDDQTHRKGEVVHVALLKDIERARLYHNGSRDVDSIAQEDEEAIDYYCELIGAENGEWDKARRWLRDWEG